MAYVERQVFSFKEAFWKLQLLMRSSEYEDWRYLGGELAGLDRPQGDEAFWDVEDVESVNLLDGDFLVLQAPEAMDTPLVEGEYGVVEIFYNETDNVVELRAHSAGWSIPLNEALAGDVYLGDAESCPIAARFEHAITAVDDGPANEFTVAGDITGDLQEGDTFRVYGSTGNDGLYTVASIVGGGNTVIEADEDIVSAVVDGNIVFTDITWLKVIVNRRRAIVMGTDPGNLDPPYFGYVGLIQSHYTDDIGGAEDPNPLLVTGGPEIPGEAASSAAMRMVNPITLVADTYKTNMRVAGLLDTDGIDMLANMQPNKRNAPNSRSLIPCIVGCLTAGNVEIRGELEGVFFFGPADLPDDAGLTRSDGSYVVISNIAVGPVAA